MAELMDGWLSKIVDYQSMVHLRTWSTVCIIKNKLGSKESDKWDSRKIYLVSRSIWNRSSYGGTMEVTTQGAVINSQYFH